MMPDKMESKRAASYPAGLDDVISLLGLVPLEGEGGMWSRGYISDEMLPGGLLEGRDTARPVYSTIYYLLTLESYSGMHCLLSDEIWYHHYGPPVSILLVRPGEGCSLRILGPDIAAGERPQVAVRRGTYMGAVISPAAAELISGRASSSASPEDEGVRISPEGIYTLMSTSNAPAYEADDFKAGTYEELSGSVPEEYMELLRLLTGMPVYG